MPRREFKEGEAYTVREYAFTVREVVERTAYVAVSQRGSERACRREAREYAAAVLGRTPEVYSNKRILRETSRLVETGTRGEVW